MQRRVWASIGARPVALGHHRFDWLYATAFVAPASGETVWYLSNGIDKPFFERLLAAFARETGAGRDRIILLVLDNAGWHAEPGLAVSDGIRLLYLPPYTPELQPADRTKSRPHLGVLGGLGPRRAGVHLAVACAPCCVPLFSIAPAPPNIQHFAAKYPARRFPCSGRGCGAWPRMQREACWRPSWPPAGASARTGAVRRLRMFRIGAGLRLGKDAT